MANRKKNKIGATRGVLTMLGVAFTISVMVQSCSTPAYAGKVVWGKDGKAKVVGDENKTVRGCMQSNPLLNNKLGKALQNPLKVKKTSCKGDRG